MGVSKDIEAVKLRWRGGGEVDANSRVYGLIVVVCEGLKSRYGKITAHGISIMTFHWSSSIPGILSNPAEALI